jgi:hypothetical protein
MKILIYNNKYYSGLRLVHTNTDFEPQSEEIRGESERLNERIMVTGVILSDNEQEIKSNFEDIKDIHDNMRENLDSSTNSELIDADNKQAETIAEYRKELFKDDASRFPGISAGEIKRDMVESEINHTKHVKEILDNSNVKLPEGLVDYYNNLIQRQTELNETNIELNEEQTNNYSDYYDFNNRAYGNLIDSRGPVGDLADSTSEVSSNNEPNTENNETENPLVDEEVSSNNEDNSANTGIQGSLVDDYADTSTEQPSYMDPED